MPWLDDKLPLEGEEKRGCLRGLARLGVVQQCNGEWNNKKGEIRFHFGGSASANEEFKLNYCSDVL